MATKRGTPEKRDIGNSVPLTCVDNEDAWKENKRNAIFTLAVYNLMNA